MGLCCSPSTHARLAGCHSRWALRAQLWPHISWCHFPCHRADRPWRLCGSQPPKEEQAGRPRHSQATQPSNSAVLIRCGGGRGGGTHWGGHTSSQLMIALLVSVAPGPAGWQMAPEHEEAALPYPNPMSMSMYYLACTLGLPSSGHWPCTD